MDSWNAQKKLEFFMGNIALSNSYYAVDYYYITYQRWGVWQEMKFIHNLN